MIEPMKLCNYSEGQDEGIAPHSYRLQLLPTLHPYPLRKLHRVEQDTLQYHQIQVYCDRVDPYTNEQHNSNILFT